VPPLSNGAYAQHRIYSPFAQRGRAITSAMAPCSIPHVNQSASRKTTPLVLCKKLLLGMRDFCGFLQLNRESALSIFFRDALTIKAQNEILSKYKTKINNCGTLIEQ
jgi:hypothetical protein